MSTLVYSASAKKAIARYLTTYAQNELSGGSPYLGLHLNVFALAALKQIMQDNGEVTGYSATLAEIKLEKEA